MTAPTPAMCTIRNRQPCTPTNCPELQLAGRSHMAKKNPAAVQLGRKGGKAAAKNRTKEERKAQARKAAQARWSKAQKPQR